MRVHWHNKSTQVKLDPQQVQGRHQGSDVLYSWMDYGPGKKTGKFPVKEDKTC